jgi:hypothetical protein
LVSQAFGPFGSPTFVLFVPQPVLKSANGLKLFGSAYRTRTLNGSPFEKYVQSTVTWLPPYVVPGAPLTPRV